MSVVPTSPRLPTSAEWLVDLTTSDPEDDDDEDDAHDGRNGDVHDDAEGPDVQYMHTQRPEDNKRVVRPLRAKRQMLLALPGMKGHELT